MPRSKDKITELRRPGTAKWSSLGLREERGGVSWSDADPVLLRSAATAVVEDGAALLLSKTSDGGALVIQVWTGESRHKLYPASIGELQEALQLLIEVGSS